MKKTKRWIPNRMHLAFRRSRSTVERLEDRILLSAEPLIQFNRADGEQPLVVENLAYSANKRMADPLDLEAISSIATLIDLTRPQSQQNSKLNWTGSTSSLLKLNSQLQALVLDLGDGDSQMSLSNDANGMLRLSSTDGPSPYEFVFAKPSSILGIRGEGGLDRLIIDNVDLGATSLSVDAESISIPSTSTLTGQSNVLLMARHSFAGDLGQLTLGADDLELSASIDVAGTLQVVGNVVLAAQVSVELEQEVTLTGYYEVNGSTTARVRISDGAKITAQSLALSAITESRWALAANDGLIGGRLALDLAQTTEALVEGGVDISVAPMADDEGNPGMGLLIEAIDWTDASVVLDMADGEITGLSKGTQAGQALEGFELGWTQIDVLRQTVAGLGSEASTSKPTRISSVDGLVQIAAASLDGAGNEDGENAGIYGSVMSSLVGLHISNIDHDVQAFVANSALEVGALNVYALNETSALANGKIARNKVEGNTQAWVEGSDLSSAGAIALIAQDLASFSATSEGFSADIPKLDTLKVGIASTTNTVDRKVSAYLLSSTVSASDMAVLASNDSSLSVSLESMAVFDSEATEGEEPAETPAETPADTPAEGEDGGSGMQMAFGGTFAWNQFNGQVLAYVEDSTLETTDGDLVVQAVNSAALEAQSKAGTAVTSGAAAGASLAFNAVGWDMGNIAAAGLNSILGTDIGATASPLLTQAYVRGSDLTVAGEMSLSAENTMGIQALISNSADVLGGGTGSGLSVGAAMILASNRVRSDTRAFVDGNKPLAGADQAALCRSGTASSCRIS